MRETRRPMQPPLSPARARRIALSGTLPPERAVELVCGDSAPAVLTGRWAQLSAIVASDPLCIVPESDDPLAALDSGRALDAADDEIAVGGGWIGLLSYGACLRAGGIAIAQPPARERLPQHVLAYYDNVLVRDQEGRWWLELLWRPERADALREREAVLRQRLAAAAARAAIRPATAAGRWTQQPSPDGHARAVQACVERIAAGDLYEANLALRFRATTGWNVDPAALFTAGVAALSPDRGAFLEGDWGAVVSLSPELLASRRGELLTSEPIKGTRPNPAGDPASATRLHDELAGSEKDRAENVMIVDLMRNDLGRVCVPGSVVAGPICEVRPMAGVWQLVSEVRGRVRPGVPDSEICAALLPAGSVTGAPKQAAAAVIAELESVARQAFCGSVVLASACGLELSVVIRTLEFAGQDSGRRVGWLDAGGAVTSGSDPAAEAAECLVKAEPLLAAIGAHAGDAPTASTGDVVLPSRLAARPLPRPGAAAGVFTTIRCEDGVALAPGDHLARLAESADALYDIALPDGIERAIAGHAAATTGVARLRARLTPDGEFEIETGPLAGVQMPLVLVPVCVPGGLGAHKLCDRRLIDGLTAATHPAEPLICDLDGEVLETGRFALLAKIGGRLLTPPADGRILPSIAVRALIAAGDAEPARLTLEDLRAADAIHVANALRGMIAAQLAPARASPVSSSR